MKILVVDDDFELRSIVGFALRQGGYLALEAGDGTAALAAVETEQPALIVLDLNLPGGDGLALLPGLRARTAAPVLVLSVRSAEEDVVRALDLGADDYLTKPFSPRTLLARIRALLRRAGVERPEPLEVGDLVARPRASQRAGRQRPAGPPHSARAPAAAASRGIGGGDGGDRAAPGAHLGGPRSGGTPAPQTAGASPASEDRARSGVATPHRHRGRRGLPARPPPELKQRPGRRGRRLAGLQPA